MEIKITYHGELNHEVEKQIESLLEGGGWRKSGSGYHLIDGYRDMWFKNKDIVQEPTLSGRKDVEAEVDQTPQG